MLRILLLCLAVLIAAPPLFIGFCYREARSDPVVREATVALPDWPTGAPPMRVVLISDIHIGSAAMDSARLTRVVGQINALHPDLVLLAGDYIAGSRMGLADKLGRAMVAPLSRLHARYGAVAAIGNHDWSTGPDDVVAQLEAANVRVVDNSAIQVGPLALGGVADKFSHHADIDATLDAVRALPGAHVLLTHSPDIAPSLPPDMPLLFAGHTHCGQIVFPIYGPLASVTRYGERYRCGVRREGPRTVIVTAGLGTSGAPYRFGAPPDLWLVTLTSEH